MANPPNLDEFDGVVDGPPLARANWDGDTGVYGLFSDDLQVYTDGPGIIVWTVDMGTTQQGYLEFKTTPVLAAGDMVGLVLKKQAIMGLCDAVFVLWEPATNQVRVQLCEGAGPNMTVGTAAPVPSGVLFLSARMNAAGRVEVYAGATALTATCVLAVEVTWTHAGGGGFVGIGSVGASGTTIAKFGAD